MELPAAAVMEIYELRKAGIPVTAPTMKRSVATNTERRPC